MVKFYFESQAVALRHRKKLKQFIVFLFKQEKASLSELTYIFCSDAYLLSINKEFLKHDFYTDIVTFVLSEPGEPIIGEIYISLDRVQENALTYGVATQNELFRVILHGALHLCGFTDKSKAEKISMTEAENRYLELFYA